MDTAPDRPVLVSPADDLTIDDKTVPLSWNEPTDWGNNCDDNTNTYQVCIGMASGECTWGASGLADTTPFQFTGSTNATYYWKVIANNGALTMDSEIWNFDLIPRPDLCESTAIEFLSGTGGKNSARVTSTAVNNNITAFSLAFYNLDNSIGGIPQAYCLSGTVAGNDCNQYGLGFTVPDGGTQESYTFLDIAFDDLSGPDTNWGVGTTVPERLQINGYFVDDLGRVSFPNPLCVGYISKVEGQVYFDDGAVCNSADRPYLTLSSSCGGSITNSGGSDFHLLACDGTTGLTVAMDPVYGCSIRPGCNLSSCPLRTVITGSGVSENFYYGLMKPSWWQVDGGNIHADSGDVISNIPSTADSQYLITGVPGLVSYSVGYDVGEGTINQTAGSEWRAETVFGGLVTDYGYFARILADDPAGFSPWDGSEPTGSNGVFLGSGIPETSGGDWIVDSGEVYVILAPNDLLINNNISVAPGGFLAIISSGNITIADSVTNVEGVYVADGVFSAGSGNLQFTGEGIFTGWDSNVIGNGIDLSGRDFNSLENNTTPVIKFIYRPDLVRNAYQYLLKSKITWQEVAP
ncbi:MAG: hypothetical protein U0946_00815 [Patescibacteria group bacterium]|nr:hypothetical protein [Patescibacteria group bacterium]